MAETFSPVTLQNDTGQKLNADYFNRLETNMEVFDDRIAAREIGVDVPVTVPYSATVTINAALGALFRVVATGNVALQEPINGSDGQLITVQILASGGQRTLTFPGSSLDAVTIPSGQWWVGVFRLNAVTDEWHLDDSGGAGTSGIPPTIVDAKGDLIVATGAGTVTRFPVGANGSIPVAASGQATGLTYTPMFQVHAVGNSGSALTLDASSTSGSIKTITLTANCTFTLTGASAGLVTTLELVLTQDGTGGRTVTWPASVKWVGGAPILATAAASVTRVALTSYDGGTTWFGDLIGGGYA